MNLLPASSPVASRTSDRCCWSTRTSGSRPPTNEPRTTRPCVDLLARHVGRLVTPVTVIVETAWLIESRLGPAAETRFLRTVTTPEAVTIIDLTPTDWVRVIELVDTYVDLGLGTVDASIIAVAERLGITTIATMNHATSESSAPPTPPRSICSLTTAFRNATRIWFATASGTAFTPAGCSSARD